MITETTEEVVIVSVGDSMLGLPLDRVHEITRQLDRTPVPRGGAEILGVVNLRGEIVTLLDLGMILFDRRTSDDKTTRTVIVQHEDERIGLNIDRVGDVVKFDRANIERLPTHVSEAESKFFRGVVQRDDGLLLVVDIGAVIAAST